MSKTVKIGDMVNVVDEVGVEHKALVTASWGPGGDEGQTYDDTQPVHLAINLVFVSSDANKRDCYGCQTEHLSSVSHKSTAGSCPGRYWWQD